jgi:hypothetical protein
MMNKDKEFKKRNQPANYLPSLLVAESTFWRGLILGFLKWRIFTTISFDA